MSESPDPTTVATDVAAQPATLREKLAAGRFVVSAEVDPPHGLRTRRALQGATLLQQAGVDCINVGDNPTAKVRMSPLAMSVLLQRELGLEIIMHYTTRDRNALAVHSDMIGAHALGIRNILCLRGDPPTLGGYNDVVGVWDISAVGLMRFLKLLNEGADWTGKPVSGQADFLIGAACDPNVEPLEPQLRLMRRKIEAGAQFFMTQNVFDGKTLDRFLDKTRRFRLPIIAGVLPLSNSRHAEFLHTQVPGMHIPEKVRERMRRAGDDGGPREGQAMARDFIALCRDRCAGIYLVPSFGRFDLVAELVAEIKS
jgi:5,10-methylenetetrahydrofolate reductase